MSTKLLWLLSAFSMSSAGYALDSIGWHYKGAGADTLAPGDVAGAGDFAQSNWNNQGGRGKGAGVAPFELKDNQGKASGAALSAWTQGTKDNGSLEIKSPAPNEKLLASFAAKNPSLTFSDIPEAYIKGGYSVVVYYMAPASGESVLTLAGSRNDEASRAIVSGGEQSAHRSGGFVQETGGHKGPTNYTVFTRLNDPDFKISLTGDSGTGFCAVQIVAEHGAPMPESKAPVTTASPAQEATGFKPWQPISWTPAGDGESSYDVYVWPADAPAPPRAPVATVKKPLFTPPAYLAANKSYKWRIISHLESGKKFISPEFHFTTGGLEGQPPFDVSSAGVAARTAEVESMKGIAKLVAKGPTGYVIPNNATLAFYGDSITDVATYFDDIAAALKKAKAEPGFPNVTVLNRGINGATSDDLLNLPDGDQWKGGSGPNPPKPFKEQVDEDLAKLAAGTAYVAIIQIGINDVLQGDKTPKATYKERLLQMTDYVLGKGQLVVLVTPDVAHESPIAEITDDKLFDDAGNALLNGYVEALQEIGQERGVPFVNQRKAYLDVLKNENTVIAADGTVSYPKSAGILNGDGIHPGPRGKELSSECAALGIYQAFAKKSGTAKK